MSERKDTILVTGTSGRIGYPVAKRLAESYNVVGFDRRAPSHPPPSAECLYVDLTSEESVRRGLQAIRDLHGNHIASVIHLAAYYDFSGAPSPLYDRVTVEGTARLLRMLQDFEVDQFIFSSTELVHAPSGPGQRIDEDSPLEPTWPYPESKVKTEQVIHSERGNIPTVILRIAGVYDDLCDSIPIAQQLQRIYEHDITAYLFPGDLSAGRQTFVHNEDVVDAILLAVARRKELSPETVLLIGEPETLSYDEFQRTCGQLIHGVTWKTYSLPKSLAKVAAWAQEKLPLNRPPFIKPWMIDLAADNFEVDITRARTILGWEPKHSLRDALPGMVLTLKADPFAWYRENNLEPPLWLQELAPAGEPTKEAEPHELMRLDEEVRRAIATPTPMPSSGPPEHENMDMGDASVESHGSMDMGMNESKPTAWEAESHAKERQLEQLRAQQTQLAQAYEREVAAQKKEDALAHELMERDPRGHIEMMKMEQTHRQLALELPRMLLHYEANVYQELQNALAAALARLPDASKMMGQMVAMARWSQIPLLVLGAWLIASPFTLGYQSMALVWNDVISGILVLVLGDGLSYRACLAGMGKHIRRAVAGFRPAPLLVAKRRRVCERYVGGYAGDRLFRPCPDDDADAGTGSATRVVVQPLELDTARTHPGARPIEFSHIALHGSLPIGPHLLGVGSDLCQWHGPGSHFDRLQSVSHLRCGTGRVHLSHRTPVGFHG